MFRTIFAFALLPLPLAALTLELPGAPEITAQETAAVGVLNVPTAAWNGTQVPGIKIPGALTQAAYQSDTVFRPDRIAASILPQLQDQGYELTLMCADTQCGGYDFRFALPVLAPPGMYVDIGNFVFIAARKGDDTAAWVLISNSLAQSHVQITTVAPPGEATVATSVVEQPVPQDLAQSLDAYGHFILADLTFQTGSSQLDGTRFASLQQLADYLSANPKRTIALVGHTDAVGSLAGNIALSKRRATAVRTLLLQTYGVADDRVAAEGMGYLSPVTTNTTDTGRKQNRRVEVIVTSTE
ncbi:MAG: OmpA family protein [Planktomarina sp.]